MSETSDAVLSRAGPIPVGGAGAWAWDLTSGRLWGDDRFARLYGVDPSNGDPQPQRVVGMHAPEEDLARQPVGRLGRVDVVEAGEAVVAP